MTMKWAMVLDVIQNVVKASGASVELTVNSDMS